MEIKGNLGRGGWTGHIHREDVPPPRELAQRGELRVESIVQRLRRTAQFQPQQQAL